MYPALREPSSSLCSSSERDQSDLLRSVLRILGSTGVGRARVERRSDERFPFPYIMYLKPPSSEFETSSSDTSTVVVGKHISKYGLDFYHHQPLPHRHMIVAVEDANRRWVHLMLDITWCRFIRQGWYASGGKFLGVVDASPDQSPGEEHKTNESADQALVLAEATTAAAH